MRFRRTIKTVAVAVACALTAVTAGSAQEAQDAPEENARNADLLRLQEWVLIDRSLHPSKVRGALMKLEGLRRNTSQTMSDAEFYLTAASITALADNGHSNISSSPIYKEFGVAPIRAYWFDEGLVITRADKAYAELAGARITAIEGHSLDEMLAKIDPYHGGTMGVMKAYTALGFMMSLPLLEAMAIVTDGSLTLSVVTARGEATTVDFGPDAMSKSIGRIWPWEQLVQGKENDSHDWVSVRPVSEALWLAASDKNFQLKRLDGNIAYIQFRRNMSAKDEDIKTFMQKVTDDLTANPPRAIILDNRQNIGGDLTLTAEFSQALPDLLQEDGKIYSLTGNATFSAGIYNAMTPKAAAPERTLVVGEVVGDRTAFWAERWMGFTLPQSGWALNYSLQKHDIGEGCNDPMVCHLAGRGAINIAVGSVEPDHEVAMSFADYIAGRDALLDAALAMIGG